MVSFSFEPGCATTKYSRYSKCCLSLFSGFYLMLDMLPEMTKISKMLICIIAKRVIILDLVMS